MDPICKHKEDARLDGSCRMGMCFYTDSEFTVKLTVHDSPVYQYSLSIEMRKGLNILSWCDETMLNHKDDYVARFAKNTPVFEINYNNIGFNLTTEFKENKSDEGSTYLHRPELGPVLHPLMTVMDQPVPPFLTIISPPGTVPSLYLLAKVAGGRDGLFHEGVRKEFVWN